MMTTTTAANTEKILKTARGRRYFTYKGTQKPRKPETMESHF